jgi:ATP-dependent RNA helicase RhlE
MSFEKFALHGSLLRGIKDAGYEIPTDIQEKALPHALEGRDVLGCAMTGSGKTAAFVLPILERLFKKSRGVTRALILCPTRELAMQINEAIQELGKYAPVKSATIFGGVPMKGQVQAFERGIDILIATPGRLMDHFQYNYAKLNSLEVLVFDEADRMLDMGFLPSIKKILQHIPKPQQTLFFSATMPSQIGQLAKDLLNRPITLNVERQAKPATGITQSSFPVPQSLKPALLLELLAQNPIESAIVFTRTKHRANGLQKYLASYGVNCERIHGNRSQSQRTEALKGFKSGKYRVLVATDIAARGIDVQDLEYVINFDVPAIPEDYIHRVGRTARAERTGEALTFFSKEEESQLFDIERAIGQKLPREWVDGFNYKAVGEKMTVDRGDSRQGDPRRNAPRRSPQGARGQATQPARGQATQPARGDSPQPRSATTQQGVGKPRSEHPRPSSIQRDNSRSPRR